VIKMKLWDSTDRGVIPSDATAVAGYGGTRNRYQSFWWFQQDYPNARHVFICCSALDDGPDGHQDVALDIEQGNADPGEAVGWVRRQWTLGITRPILYAPLVLMQQVLIDLAGASIALSGVRIWTSHPTGVQHRCTAVCGYGMPAAAVDATQYVWNPAGVNVDISELRDDFFDPPTPTPIAPEGAAMVMCIQNHDGRLEWTAQNEQTGEVFHTWQTTPGGALVGAQTGQRTCEWFSLGIPWKNV
jgi:hypothetical protein